MRSNLKIHASAGRLFLGKAVKRVLVWFEKSVLGITIPLALWCCIGFFWPLLAIAAVDQENCPAYIYISPGEQFREKTGAVTQRYYVRCHRDACFTGDNSMDLQAFCRLTSIASRPTGYCRVPLQYGKNTAFVDIQAFTNTHVDLCIYGKCHGQFYAARTSQPLYGSAQTAPRAEDEVFEEVPLDLPRLELKHTRHTYFLQTGQTYHFEYINKNGLAKTAAIIKKGAWIQTLALTPEHNLAYTPPHDPELDNSGSYATSETVILVDEPDADTPCTVTFTLLLHRSLFAHFRLRPGVILFFAAAGVTLVPVIIKWRTW